MKLISTRKEEFYRTQWTQISSEASVQKENRAEATLDPAPRGLWTGPGVRKRLCTPRNPAHSVKVSELCVVV